MQAMMDNRFQPWGFELPKKKFLLALIASILVHAFLLWLIQISEPDIQLNKKSPPNIMDVVLLDDTQKKSRNETNDAKVLANKNNLGKQQDALDKTNRRQRIPTAPQPAPRNKPTPIIPAQPKNPALPPKQSKERARIIARKNEESSLTLNPNTDFKEDKNSNNPPAPDFSKLNLNPTFSALSQLDKDFARERRMKQLTSKEADIDINTRESKFAPYAQGLVSALEEQWNPAVLSYEKLSQDKRRVLIRVSIDLSGELVDIKVLRASPSPELTSSAVEAVYRAAPFKPLPSSWGLERANFFFVFEVVENRLVFRTL
jgi:TonB family protein